MDLCLPSDLSQREVSLFRDDLGPTLKPGESGTLERRSVVCGLRDWRAAVAPNPIAGTPRLSNSATLKPYRAPDWLRTCTA